ncbi:MAG: WXG100 family type VII secretion target [Chloroflexi bacterium]|nr:WXG100 family type VII secretion target [Chloroflexota bacterium]
MSTIRMSYEEMSAAAGDISKCAERTRASLQRLQKAATDLDPHWTGTARAAFDRDFAACLVEAAHFPRMLDQIGAALIVAAQTVADAEQRAQGVIAATVIDDAEQAGDA